MKKLIFFLSFLLSGFLTQSQNTKNAAQFSIDSLLPSASAVPMVKVRQAFTKALTYAESNLNGIDARALKQAGDADDSYSLQRAVNLSITTKQTVIMKAGTWTINSRATYINVPMGQTVKIKGEPGTIIDFTCQGAEGAVFKTSDTYDYIINWGTIILEGITFSGIRNPVSPLSVTVFSRPILLRDCERVEIRNCDFKNIYGSALAVGAAGSGIIENNNFLSVYGRETVNDAYGDAISVYADTKNFTITKNTAKVLYGQIGRCGISVDNGCEDVKVIDNNVEGYERGIHIEASKKISITKNHVKKSPIGGYSALNTEVTWEGNFFDASNRTNNPILAESGVFFVYFDSLCIYRNNTVKYWHGVSGTHLAKFWGSDLLIENNTFSQPNGGQIFGYGYNRRNKYIGNRFEGKGILRLDETTANIVERNEFLGGTVRAEHTTSLEIKQNTFKPDVGDSLGVGLIVYNSIKPIVSGNTFYDPGNYVIENSLSTDMICEDNTFYKSKAGATSTFYVTPSATQTDYQKGTKKNVIRNSVTKRSYYVDNNGSPYLMP